MRFLGRLAPLLIATVWLASPAGAQTPRGLVEVNDRAAFDEFSQVYSAWATRQSHARPWPWSHWMPPPCWPPPGNRTR